MCHATWQFYICKHCTTFESANTYFRNSFGNLYAFEFCTSTECIVANCFNTIGYCKINNIGIACKRIISKGCDTAGYYGILTSNQKSVCCCFNNGITVFAAIINYIFTINSNRFQSCTAFKRTTLNLGNGCRDNNASQAGASLECPF